MKVSPEFVASIRERLTSVGWNQTELAEQIGETRFWVSKLLGGKLVNITEDQILRIESVLELNLLPLIQTQGRERDFGSDEFVQILAEQLRSTAPAYEAFTSLFRLLHDNQLYVLPELNVHHLKSLGEQIHRLSEQAEKEPVAAARVFMAHFQEILSGERHRKKSSQQSPV